MMKCRPTRKFNSSWKIATHVEISNIFQETILLNYHYCHYIWDVIDFNLFAHSIPPPKEVMFSLRSVCLFICLFVMSVCPSDNWKSCERIFDEISWRGRAWPRDQLVPFWWRSGSLSGSRSPNSEIRIHWIIELRTDFDEILRRAGV